jgi:MFS family permease
MTGWRVAVARPGGQRLGRRFGWLWGAYAVSAYGTGLGFGAFPLIAVLVLHSGPAQVAALSAAGRAVGAALAVPLGPWVEFHRKRPVMVAMDLARCAALLSVPAAFAFGGLGFAQLLVVSVVTASADIAFRAASGAYLKALVPREQLLIANSRFESTTWSATIVGPPLGGAAIGVFGPVTTVVADAASYLLSALGIGAIGGEEPQPARAVSAPTSRPRRADLLAGWRHILGHPALRPLFFNVLAVNALIMASEPLMAVLLLGRLGYAPWQYGLAFAAPCVGGLVGSRVARPLAARFGQRRVLMVSGVLRVVWPVGLAFVGRGASGMLLVMVLQFGLVACCGVFNPLLATARLEHTPPELVARTLAAWTISTSAAIAGVTAAWGSLAAAVGPRAAIGAAGVLMLATPVLLPRRPRAAAPGGLVTSDTQAEPVSR